jgi:hypothetical protein
VEPLQVGLLLEAAETHQRLAEEALSRLSAHAASLDGVVREAVRGALIDGVGEVFTESARATHSLRRLGRAAQLRTVLWSVAITLAASLVPVGVLQLLVPSRAELAALEQRREALAASMKPLQDANVDLRRCGGRLCARVDRGAGAWGEHADYFVLAGSMSRGRP